MYYWLHTLIEFLCFVFKNLYEKMNTEHNLQLNYVLVKCGALPHYHNMAFRVRKQFVRAARAIIISSNYATAPRGLPRPRRQRCCTETMQI